MTQLQTPISPGSRSRLMNASPDEIFIVDPRGSLTPAQMVEHKLKTLLDTTPLLVSHLQDSIKKRPR